jgi:hypothetical protein
MIDWVNDQTAINGTNLNKLIQETDTVTATGEDLNNYVKPGTFFFDSEATPLNIPTGNNGYLEVIQGNRNNDTIGVKQIWHRHGTVNNNDYQTFERTFSNGTWSDWQQYAMLNKKGGITELYFGNCAVGDTISLSESPSNFRLLLIRLQGQASYIVCPIYPGQASIRALTPFISTSAQDYITLFAIRGTFSSNNFTYENATTLKVATSGIAQENVYSIVGIYGIR